MILDYMLGHAPAVLVAVTLAALIAAVGAVVVRVIRARAGRRGVSPRGGWRG